MFEVMRTNDGVTGFKATSSPLPSGQRSTIDKMSTFDDVNAAIERRLAGIHDYSLEQLRNCTGPLSMHEELVDGIRQDMNTIESLLEVRLLCNRCLLVA